MVRRLIRNQLLGNQLRVRLPCPPLQKSGPLQVLNHHRLAKWLGSRAPGCPGFDYSASAADFTAVAACAFSAILCGVDEPE